MSMNVAMRAGLLLASLTVLPAAQAETVRARYGISLIGLPFGTATVTGTLEPQAYRIEMQAKLTGLASILSGSKGAATATGSIPNSHVSPTTYATTSASADITRTVRMSIVDGTVDQSEITPPWDPSPDRVPVTDADKRGIVDPMSALIMTVPGTGDVIGPAACERTIPVFDGAARFDIVLAYVGTRKVKAKGFAGNVAVCSVRYRPIAGHRANRPGTKFMADNKEMEAWLAPVGQSRIVVPYRISVMTMIGTVVTEATEFDVSGGPRADVQNH
ncbi:DUF3108 domain-containing protein [Lichenifustis flavocetrariae]|uniref:DUF3108 domain-containing protein n=1 Tax=Lichenifustis flavocetrariae TaxID=2949735 RepID=A0AA42CJC5_9HYPH|nr:DUF3108 domain-containing protein [Lichenifustis flavocetrariae]MCW6509438.1 DUF3108 domain-containing protein [Lichenifustis flavocetrariae]